MGCVRTPGADLRNRIVITDEERGCAAGSELCDLFLVAIFDSRYIVMV